MITLSQAGVSDSMAETDLRAKRIGGAAPTTAVGVMAGAVNIPRLRWLIIGLVFLATLIFSEGTDEELSRSIS